MKVKNTKIKEIILGLIISIVFLMFAVYGTKLIYDSPEYSDYCPERAMLKEDLNRSPEQINEYQEEIRECSEEYEKVREVYSKNMFIISLVVSVAVILFAIVLIKIESIYGGLMFGSLMFLINGTGGYWRYMDDLIRFLILGLSLGILIYAGYWLAKKK